MAIFDKTKKFKIFKEAGRKISSIRFTYPPAVNNNLYVHFDDTNSSIILLQEENMQVEDLIIDSSGQKYIVTEILGNPFQKDVSYTVKNEQTTEQVTCVKALIKKYNPPV